MLIDLHTHTKRFSWDSDLEVDELVQGCRRAGLDGVCLTEHDYFWPEEEVRRIARKHDFLVLPGVEINTEEGHMLCFGLPGYVFGMHRGAELAEHVLRCGGAMVAAHPYRRQAPWHPDDPAEREAALTRGQKPVYRACAALEQINGRGSEAENAFSFELCERVGLAATAGSDAHTLDDVGTCATEFLSPIAELGDLIAALKQGQFRPVTLK